MKKVITCTRAMQLIGALSLLFTISANAVNVTFDGELQDRPCQIDPSSLNQTVEFLERPAKDFQWAPAKSPAEKFSIRLVDCDTNSIWKIVKLKFSGSNEPNMTGRSDYFLRVTGVNQGKLGIGLLDTDGTTLMKLGEAHNNKQGTSITGKTITLNFKAFVQATPDAIAKKSVQPGNYTSVANFELFYE